jgi:predicted nuclease of predicted toxin-antitoxin system
MRILLDENLNWRLERALPGHVVASVQRNGMDGLKNGELLARAALEFDVFITMDGNIAFQQNYAKLPLRIVALRAASNRLADTEPLMPKLLALLPTLQPGTLTAIATE